MKKPVYMCIVESDSTFPREYPVSTRSAMKCSARFGRCESGEIVTVRDSSGKPISRVMHIGYRWCQITI